MTRKIWHFWRSSKTGRFVKKSYAEQNPDTTEEETVRK